MNQRPASQGGGRAAGQRREELTRAQELFALEYLANGYNAAAAYRATHRDCHSNNAASVEGHRLLRNPKVLRFIEREHQERVAKLRMDADEAMEGLTRIARADIRQLFDSCGNPLPVHQWPVGVADAVKSVRSTCFGPSIVMYDKLRAFELLAIAGGKLRPGQAKKQGFDLAAYLGREPPPGDDN